MRIYVTSAENDCQLAAEIAQQLRRIPELVVTGAGMVPLPGENWAALRAHELEEADWCVFVLTRGSVTASERLRGELQFVFARERYKDRVIPILAASNSVAGQDIPWAVMQLPGFRQTPTRDAERAVEAILDVIKGSPVGT